MPLFCCVSQVLYTDFQNKFRQYKLKSIFLKAVLVCKSSSVGYVYVFFIVTISSYLFPWIYMYDGVKDYVCFKVCLVM